MSHFALYSSLWLLDMFILSQLGPAGRLPIPFVSCYLVGFLLMFQMIRNCPRQWSDGRIILVVVGIGILGRVFFLTNYPVSNDVFRYIWEGYIQNHGINPYLQAPDHSELAFLRSGNLAGIWEGINHKDLSGAYPPVVMLLFRGVSAISATPFFYQCTMLLFDMVVIFFLVLFCRNQRLSPVCLLFYTANPFILVYAVGEAHLDIIQAAFVTGGLYCIITKKNFRGFLLLGAAIFSKYLAIIALPFVIKRSNLYALPLAALPGLAVLPFFHDFNAIFESLMVFGTTMHYNDGVAELFRYFTGGLSVPVLVVLLLVILVIIYLLEHEYIRSVYLAIGTLLLLLPTMHPWYLLLIAPFLVIYPSRAWVYLMISVIATVPVMAIEYQTGIFQEIKVLKLIEYLPFFGLLVYDFWNRKPYQVTKISPYPKVQSVSVVIPTLNEADHIGQLLFLLGQHREVSEIIVVDGESGDSTREIARACGAVVITSSPGRGLQVEKGVLQATGDVIIVLHADTTLHNGAISRMVNCLNGYPSIPGGAFAMEFSGKSLKLKLISMLNNLRAKWCGISFGDQAQFFRRAALLHLDGFPSVMLMEDVELSMRLKKYGRPLFISQGVKVSERGWVKKGFAGNFSLVLSLFLNFLLERRFFGTTRQNDGYYHRYYHKS